jgi:hypothetical protein
MISPKRHASPFNPNSPSPCAGLDAYINLLERCWAQAPADRPTFHEIVQELVAMEGAL